MWLHLLDNRRDYLLQCLSQTKHMSYLNGHLLPLLPLLLLLLQCSIQIRTQSLQFPLLYHPQHQLSLPLQCLTQTKHMGYPDRHLPHLLLQCSIQTRIQWLEFPLLYHPHRQL